jgi:hypothetical protein
MLPKIGVTALCVVWAAAAQEETKPQLTARELYYSAAEPAKPAPATKSRAAAAPQKKAVATQIASNSKGPAPSASPAPPAPPSHDGAQIITAANISAPPPVSGTPLGLKYIILKSSSGQMLEVPADTTFHAGDRIQLNVETNSTGYLYVISQGSSGAWKPIFPSPEVAEGNNRVEAFHQYVLPPKSRLLFDEQTGTEKVFVVFSREPEPSLEKMIYSLQGVSPTSAPKPAAPSQSEPAQPKTLMALADASIDDRTVGLLRTAYSRDLIIEKVDDSTAPTGNADRKEKETAVYVVNPSGSTDSRLVADLQLVHR